ncbi:MAG: DsbA family protein [Candidatus Thiodiazotropha sp.]
MPHLYYVHDPMCSWCWAFRTQLQTLRQCLPAGISHSRLLGGLAPDTDEPMPQAMRDHLQTTWRRIQERVPDTEFNFEFWKQTTPRRATYPACRAVIAARSLMPEAEEQMILAIQQAYYLEARNPSDEPVLVSLAEAIGLDRQRFTEALRNTSTQRTLEEEIKHSRDLGVHSFPSLVLEVGSGHWPIPIDYLSAQTMLETIVMILDG